MIVISQTVERRIYSKQFRQVNKYLSSKLMKSMFFCYFWYFWNKPTPKYIIKPNKAKDET